MARNPLQSGGRCHYGLWAQCSGLVLGVMVVCFALFPPLFTLTPLLSAPPPQLLEFCFTSVS